MSKEEFSIFLFGVMVGMLIVLGLNILIHYMIKDFQNTFSKAIDEGFKRLLNNNKKGFATGGIVPKNKDSDKIYTKLEEAKKDENQQIYH